MQLFTILSYLTELLYSGGIPSDIRNADSKPLRSKHGFQGCLANLHLNEDSPDLVQDALLPSTLIVSGCEGGSGKRCNHNTCDNRGICVQQWNNQICDCSMTSFAGKTCSQGRDFIVSLDFTPMHCFVINLLRLFVQNPYLTSSDLVKVSLLIRFLRIEDLK